MSHFLFKDRDGQTPLPPELRKGLKPKNIQTIGELDEYEEENIVEGLVWLRKQLKNSLDYYFWLQLHKKLFGNVWSWAGKVREHEFQNPDFLLPYDIWPNLKKLQDDMNYWLTNKTFSEQEITARFHERLLTIHPFANGNGRFSRILTEYFCKENDFEIPSWGETYKKDPSERRIRYIESIDRARHQHQYQELSKFIFG